MTPRDFVYSKIVQFEDIDSAGLFNFKSALRFIEEAERAFYRSAGHSGYSRTDGWIDWTTHVAAARIFGTRMPPPEFIYSKIVEFADTDSAELLHFASAFRYFEEAEHAFYRSVGHKGYRRTEDWIYGTPRVAAEAEYLEPVRYGDEVEVRLGVNHIGNTSIGYDAAIVAADLGEPIVAVRGTLRVVCARRRSGSALWEPMPIPDFLRSKLAKIF